MNKIISKNQLSLVIQEIRAKNEKIVFTNGCFDIVHLGHLKLLEKCKELGTVFLGINSDNSVRRLKGNSRPINNIEYRAEFLSHLKYVDFIIVFDDDTPEQLIKEISPDFLVKGNDYNPKNIVGYNFVTSYGGKVLTFGFNINKSTSKLLLDIENRDKYSYSVKSRSNFYIDLFYDINLKEQINKSYNILKECIDNNGKIFIAGNGGSAEQSNHFAAELMGHYKNTKKFIPAISLCENISLITALSNDYSYSEIFAKSMLPLVSKNDCLFLISVSGNSENIIEAIQSAKKNNIKTILLTSKMIKNEHKNISNCTICVNSDQCDIVQEAHLFIIHYLSEMLKDE